MHMTDIEIIKALGGYRSLFGLLPLETRPTYEGVHKWKYHGIPARWRPTVWALLEGRCPDIAASLDRDEFLGVRIPAVVDADTAA